MNMENDVFNNNPFKTKGNIFQKNLFCQKDMYNVILKLCCKDKWSLTLYNNFKRNTVHE